MNVNQVVRTITIKGESQGVDELTGKVNNLAAAQQNVAVVSEQSARRTLSIADAWKKQTLALDEAARSSSRAASATKVAESALAEGLISTQQYASRLDLIAQKYGVVTAAAEKFARAQTLGAVNTAPAISQRLGVKDDFGTAVRANDIAAYGKQLDDVRAKYNPLFAAGRAYKENLAEINSAAKVGALSEKERASAIESTKVSFVQQVNTLRGVRDATDSTATATRTFGQQTGLARHELINLSRQAQDVGVSLASGQSPFTVLIQQGTQIADVFASSGGTVRGFFSQAAGWAGTFLKSTLGIATSVLAIGGAAIFAASQFARASTTIEQALEEQNRLLKEGKALLDARTSAEARAQLQSKEQTQFETERNRLDLQVKLNQAMEEAANISRRRATRPTEVPGEMGVAPMGFAALPDAGLDKMTAAFERLKAAQAANLPGLKEYNAELAQIGMAHPELALVVQDMLKAGEAGLKLEFATQGAKAMSDALKGIATDAQMAAVGLNTVAQFRLNNAQGVEGKARAERKATVGLQLMEEFDTKSPDIANTLAAQRDQLAVANAVGAAARVAAEEQAKYNQQLREGIAPSETLRVATGERASKQAEINTAADQELKALQGQLTVAQAVTGAAQMEAQHRETIRLKQEQGLSLAKATQIADAQRALSVAQVNAGLDQQLKALQLQAAVLRGATELDQARIKAAQDYQKAVEDGGDSLKASQVAAQSIANARTNDMAREVADAERDAANETQRRAQAAQSAAAEEERAAAAARQARIEYERIIAAFKFLPTFGNYTTGVDLFDSKQGGYSQYNPQGYASKSSAATSTSLGGLGANVNQILAQGGSTWDAFSAALSGGLSKAGKGFSTSFGGASSTIDTERLSTLERLIATMSPEGQIGATQNLLQTLNAMTPSLERDESIGRLTESLKRLTDATNQNTSATEAMTDVLSPFYSSDPRRTHLGFRSFTGGGIMTQWGELPLHKYDGGGIATSPQVAVFGEGRVPEAYVPVPSGRIPVEIRQPANTNQRQAPPVNVNIYVQGNADAGTVAALKQTGFQQAQAMRRALNG